MSFKKQDDFWLSNKAGMEYWSNCTLAIRIMKTSMPAITFPNLYYAIVYFPIEYRENKKHKTILSSERTILDRNFYNMQMRAFIMAKELGWNIKKIDLFKEEDL